MATAPSPNDLTRQQLDELDVLLQKMLTVPIAEPVTPVPKMAPAPLPPSWRRSARAGSVPGTGRSVAGRYAAAADGAKIRPYAAAEGGRARSGSHRRCRKRPRHLWRLRHLWRPRCGSRFCLSWR